MVAQCDLNLDRLAIKLKTAGINSTRSWLFDDKSFGVCNGYRISVSSGEITYRMIDEKTVLIVLYRVERKDRLSLVSSFSPLAWFVEFIKREVPSVQYIRGSVDVFPYRNERGICSKRLLKMYLRCGAVEVTEDGTRWVEMDVSKYRFVK